MAGRTTWELTELRSACDAAIDQLCAAEPNHIVVIGGGDRTDTYATSAVGSFAGYGLPLAVRLGGGDTSTPGPAATLPLSLTVGAWLLRDRPDRPIRVGQSVATDATVVDCQALGASLASGSSRLGFLIMGDGSACHGPKSPGYDDPRATPGRVADVGNRNMHKTTKRELDRADALADAFSSPQVFPDLDAERREDPK